MKSAPAIAPTAVDAKTSHFLRLWARFKLDNLLLSSSRFLSRLSSSLSSVISSNFRFFEEIYSTAEMGVASEGALESPGTPLAQDLLLLSVTVEA